MQQLYEVILGNKNKIYYRTKFVQFDRKGPGLKANWNWPAFFVGGVWALYRKMYGWFFILLGVVFVSNILEKAVQNDVVSFDIYYLLGSLYRNSGEDNAYQKLKKVIEKDKDLTERERRYFK